MAAPMEIQTSGATQSPGQAFWIEEATSLDPSQQPRGSLYLVAEGAPSETSAVLKAVRDRYFAEPLGAEPYDAAAGLSHAVQAADAALREANAIGVSLAAAVVHGGDHLVLTAVGDCRAILFHGRDGEVELFGEGQALGQPQGTTPELVKRSLADQDTLVLCSGCIAEGLHLSEIAALAGAAQTMGSEAVARRLVERAVAQGVEGTPTAVVVASRLATATAPLPPPLFAAQREPEEPQPSAQEPSPSSPVRRLLLTNPAFVGGVVVVVLLALFFGFGRLRGIGAPAAPAATPEPTTALLSTTSTPTPELSPTLAAASPTPPPTSTSPPVTATAALNLWAKVDGLWPKATGGDVHAWEQIVTLLEELKTQTPTDPRVDEKLKEARSNLRFGQKMELVSSYWPSETTPETTEAWSKTVEILEGMAQEQFSDKQNAAVQEKLYAAHVNYGHALEAAGRYHEARANYQRAIELAPSRPEAQDALQHLEAALRSK